MRVSRRRAGGDRSRPCPFWGLCRVIYRAGVSQRIAAEPIGWLTVPCGDVFGRPKRLAGIHREVAV